MEQRYCGVGAEVISRRRCISLMLINTAICHCLIAKSELIFGAEIRSKFDTSQLDFSKNQCAPLFIFIFDLRHSVSLSYFPEQSIHPLETLAEVLRQATRSNDVRRWIW